MQLANRVAALERRTHRLRGVAALLAIGLLLAVAWIVAPRPELQARRFMLYDSAGAWRGALMLNEQGEPVVRLNDPLGTARVYGLVSADGRARLRIADRRGTSRAVFEVESLGEARATLTDSAGHTVLEARVTREGRGSIVRPDSSAGR